MTQSVLHVERSEQSKGPDVHRLLVPGLGQILFAEESSRDRRDPDS